MDTNQNLSKNFEQLLKLFLIRQFGVNAVTDLNLLDNAAPASSGGDGGMDFLVHITDDSPKELFGVTLRAGQKCVVEAKSSSDSINYASVSPNLSRLQTEGYDRIFIVSNSHFPPSTQVDIFNNFKQISDRIVLIEGRTFNKWCKLKNVDWPEQISVKTPSKEKKFDSELVVESNALAIRMVGTSGRSLSMAFRNLGESEISLSVNIASDLNWHFSDKKSQKHLDPDEGLLLEWKKSPGTELSRNFVIPPGQSRAWRITGVFLDRSVSPGLDRGLQKGNKEEAARIVLKKGDRSESLFPELPPVRISLRPPFYGHEHKELSDELRPLFSRIATEEYSAALTVLHINGAAGVGKSRLVDEFLPEKTASNFALLHHVIDADQKSTKNSNEHWKYIRSVISKYYTVKPEWLESIQDLNSLLSTLITEAQISPDFGCWGGFILVIEDLHHAPKAILDKLTQLIRDNHELNTHVFLILTARNDDSFDNPDYRKFAAELDTQQRGTGVNPPIIKTVSELLPEDAKGLIGDMIEGIHKRGIDRIYQLSGAVPHHIVQCVEYLLDSTLLALTVRNTLSIIDFYTFEQRSQNLPKTMEELFFDRFENLAGSGSDFGRAAQEAVLAATVFSTHIPEAVGALVNPSIADKIINELIDRRYFARGDDQQLLWHHENIYLFFDQRRRNLAQALTCSSEVDVIAKRFHHNAQLIRNQIQLFKKLDPFSQGDITTLTGEYSVALRKFSPITKQARSIRTFSTLDADAGFFKHIEYVVEALFRSVPHPNPQTLWKLLVLKAYIGGFHKGLRFEIEAYDYGMRAIACLNLSAEIQERGRRWLRTLDGQVHMDSGFVGQALTRLLRLSHLIRVEELGGKKHARDADMLFDIYNSLRLTFTYTNFRGLAEDNGALATAYRIRSKQTVMEDMDLGDRALVYLLSDRNASIELLQQALKLNRENKGTDRHWMHSNLSLITSQLPDYKTDTEWLAQQEDYVSQVIIDCETSGYYSVLPRVYLLKSVIFYLLACATENAESTQYFSQARNVAEKGCGACEAYSIGFISWQLRSLLAILYERDSNTEIADRQMDTALANLEKEGLLLMGDDALVGPAPILLGNVVKLYAKRRNDSELLAILGKVHGLEPYNWIRQENLISIKTHAQ